MENMQLENNNNDKKLRVNVHMSGPLATQVQNQTGPNGMYENTGEYIRDLVRKDIDATPNLEDSLNMIWEQILPGALADESTFIATNREEAKASGRAYAAAHTSKRK